MQTERTIKLEAKDRFCRDAHLFPSRKHLRRSSCGRARDCANSRTLAATCNRTKQGSERGASADYLPGAFVPANSFIAFLRDIVRANQILSAVDHYRMQRQR